MTIAPASTTQVYQVFIKATPEQVWDAITKAEFTTKYFHGSSVDFSSGRMIGRGPDGSLWVEGATMEWDPPRKLVHGWRSLYDPEAAAEPESRVSWEIEPKDGGMSKLTVVHDQLEGAPKTAKGVSGEGWMYVLSGLKTILETGQPMKS